MKIAKDIRGIRKDEGAANEAKPSESKIFLFASFDLAF